MHAEFAKTFEGRARSSRRPSLVIDGEARLLSGEPRPAPRPVREAEPEWGSALRESDELAAAWTAALVRGTPWPAIALPTGAFIAGLLAFTLVVWTGTHEPDAPASGATAGLTAEYVLDRT